ncbi:threonine-phosphate decarboxylase CobD [Methylomonas koyamae]|uniref:threonine-phosphate decarboxylase CobD n=1 Tax=Methylomonas koyamae TaxID=702114 RepID=UPI0007C93BB6|nr:threonine-phosphate decarboxylase CobD [Methylomonas koyamae]ATG88569.1 threonine-phosphate decarboxylase [Methylomonas koyamae]
MLEHGGRLRQAANRYGIPLPQWLDLSTGVNPNGWPVPAVPAECWQRLPEDDDALMPAARAYYRNASILAVAGSQAAIQTLPQLRRQSRVGVLAPAYAEHAANWRHAGHHLIELAAQAEAVEQALDNLEVLIVVNPNNPTGTLWEPDRLLSWHRHLHRRGGWLIVDEAFIDTMPEYSLSALPVRPGLVVLRSIGKFFGLAGIRCGFAIAEARLLARLAEALGPWPISYPSRYVAAAALADSGWQQKNTLELKQQGRRLRQLLDAAGFTPAGGCDLFQWVADANAASLHDALARQGILTRLFDSPSSLRFGLPGGEQAWQMFAQVLADRKIKNYAALRGLEYTQANAEPINQIAPGNGTGCKGID